MLKLARGFSIVELMVAIALSLFVSLGILMFFSNYFKKESESVVISDFRKEIKDASDLMEREFRRIGYWGGAVQAHALAEKINNPFVTIKISPGCILYSYDKNHNGQPDPDEYFGFALNRSDGRIYFGDTNASVCLSGSWHPVTGQALVVKELSFEIRRSEKEIVSREGSGESGLAVQRAVGFSIKGHPKDHQSSFTYSGMARIMNDLLEMAQ